MILYLFHFTLKNVSWALVSYSFFCSQLFCLIIVVLWKTDPINLCMKSALQVKFNYRQLDRWTQLHKTTLSTWTVRKLLTKRQEHMVVLKCKLYFCTSVASSELKTANSTTTIDTHITTGRTNTGRVKGSEEEGRRENRL